MTPLGFLFIQSAEPDISCRGTAVRGGRLGVPGLPVPRRRGSYAAAWVIVCALSSCRSRDSERSADRMTRPEVWSVVAVPVDNTEAGDRDSIAGVGIVGA